MVWYMIEQAIGERAFHIRDLRAIVIGDLHIGYEKELRDKGIIIPDQMKDMQRRVKMLIEKYNARRLIILGDLKHEIMGYTPQLRKFFEDLNDVEILLVKGNHDARIEEMVDIDVYPSEGFRMGDYGFIHGHSWPAENVMKAKYVFMGHLHPEIELEDSLWKKHRYACHLIGRLTEKGRERYGGNPRIFMVAAFNKLVGSAIAQPLGPLLHNELIGDFDVYLLDGTYLGKYAYTKSSDFY